MTSASPARDELAGLGQVRGLGELQAKLRAMAYSEPVGMESVPLVARMLSDLMAANAAREKTEGALEKAQREALEFSQILLPLRKENAQLTRENNSLHLEIIHQEEAITEREKTYELQIDGLRDDIKKLQFVNTQKTQQCAQKEQEIAKLHAQLERLVATGFPPGDRSRASKIEVNGPELPPSPRRSSLDKQLSSPRARDDEREQHAKTIAALQDQIANLNAENRDLQLHCENFADKIKKREDEISRLGRVSVASINNDAVTARKLRDLEKNFETQAQQDASNLQIEQLTNQVDFLTDQVVKYEERLRDATQQLERNSGLSQKLEQTESDLEKYMSDINSLQAKYRALENEHLRCSTQASGHRIVEATAEQSPVGTLADDLNLFKEQIANLSGQKDRLEEALRATHYDKVSYTNALSNANSHNRVLASDLARAEEKLSGVTAVKVKLEQELTDAHATLSSNARELDLLRESLKRSEENRTLDNEKNASLHRELRSMDKLLSQRDEECRGLNHTLIVQKSELDRLKSKVDGGADAVGNDESDKRAVFAEEMKWLEQERQELRREKEDLMMQIIKLEEELEKTKSSFQSVQLEKDRLADKLQTADQVRENLEKALVDKKRDYANLQSELSSCKEEMHKLSDRNTQTQALLDRADDVENDRLKVQNESLGLKRRFEELRDENAALKSRAENDALIIARSRDQLQNLQRELAVASKKVTSLENEKTELSDHYESVLQELRNVRQTSTHYQSEFEKLSKELQDQQHSLSSGQNALETSQGSVLSLQNRIRQLESEVRLRQSNVHQIESRLEQEKVGHKAARNQIVMLQDELAQSKELCRARESTLKQMRDDFSSKDRALTEKVESVENLRLLVEQMESSRDQIAFQLKQRQQHVQRLNDEMDGLHGKVTNLEKQLASKNSEIASLKKLTRTLDGEKDLVNDNLDTLTERINELEHEIATLRQALETEKSSSDGVNDQLDALVSKLNERDDENANLAAHIAQLEKEIDHLEHFKAMHSAELAALTQDLENMTVENQALSEECSRLQFAHRSHSDSATSMKRATREIERERDALQIELEDLQHTYRSLVEEYEGTQQARAEINQLQDELTAANEELRRHSGSQSNQLETLKQRNVTLSTEVKTYRDQVTFLTEKLAHAQEQQEDFQSHLERVSHELDAQKQISTEISAQRYGAQAENAAVSQRIVHLESKLSNSKYELNALRQKLQKEASERRNLENLVATLRQKVAANDSMISQLEEQRHLMAHEIQSTHQRRDVSTLMSPTEMDISELNRSPPAQTGDNAATERAEQLGRNSHVHSTPSQSPESEQRSEAQSGTPKSRDEHSSSSSSILPLRALEIAQMKCQELEDRLVLQDETIKHLERSRSKFKRFAVKYERELEQRDRMIEELQTSNATFNSPGSQRMEVHHSGSESSMSTGRHSRRHRRGSSQVST